MNILTYSVCVSLNGTVVIQILKICRLFYSPYHRHTFWNSIGNCPRQTSLSTREMSIRDCISDRQSKNYESITDDMDVLITYTPPYGILDFDDDINYGFEELLTRETSIRPKFQLFGHMHKQKASLQ